MTIWIVGGVNESLSAQAKAKKISHKKWGKNIEKCFRLITFVIIILLFFSLTLVTADASSDSTSVSNDGKRNLPPSKSINISSMFKLL